MGSILNIRKNRLAKDNEYKETSIHARYSDIDKEARRNGEKRPPQDFLGWRLNELKAAARRLEIDDC